MQSLHWSLLARRRGNGEHLVLAQIFRGCGSNSSTFWLAAVFVGIVSPNPALAYVGPGAGLSAIGTVVAVIGAFLLLIVGFVWYPVKRMLRARKVNKKIAGHEPAGSKN